MRRIPAWRRYLCFWRPDVDRDVNDELRFHFEERIADLIARGRSPAAARAEAVVEFGDVDAVRDALRAIDRRVLEQRRRASWSGAAWQDVRYAMRSLGRARVLAGTVVLTLALGIGLDAAMFSFINAVFLRPPTGIASPDALRRVWAHHFETADHVPFAAVSFSYPDYVAITRVVAGSARLGAYTVDADAQLGRGVGGPKISVGYATSDFLPLLGATMALGRTYGPDEDRMGDGARVAVLSHSLWERRFAGDSAVLGRRMAIGRQQYTIIGIAQPNFSGIDVDAVDVWIPLASMPAQWYTDTWYQTRNFQGLEVVARLLPGTDPRSVEARMTALLRRPQSEGPSDTLETTEVGSIIRARGPGKPEQEVSIALRLGGVALIVLLIACANVTNLLLARAVQRRREIAVRLALGMSRGRLVAMLVIEAMLLALMAAAAATLAALWGGSMLRGLLMPNTHWAAPVFDWRVGAFTGFVALAAGVATGLAPAAQAGREDITIALKAGAREGVVQRSKLRLALLVGQGALSILLLVAAAAFIRSLYNVERLNLGFDVDHLVFGQVALDDVPSDQRGQLLRQRMPLVARRLAVINGVERVATASMAPMRGFSALFIVLPGRDSLVFPHMPPVFTAVSRDYFAATGMRVLRGRGFATSGDAEVVVNDELARTLWPGESPLGRCMQFGDRTSGCYTVAGVVENARHWELTEAPWPEYYLPLDRMPVPGWAPSVVIVRVAPSRAGLVAGELRRLLHDAYPGGVPSVRSMAEVLAPQFRPWRLGAILFSAFGLLALCVAAVGVYSTLAYTIGQRTHEIGVRMALGARGADVVQLILGETLRVVAVGIGLGALLALLLGRLISSQLYGTSPHDPLTLAATAVVLLVVASLAAAMPARRATRVDPLTALRTDG